MISAAVSPAVHASLGAGYCGTERNDEREQHNGQQDQHFEALCQNHSGQETYERSRDHFIYSLAMVYVPPERVIFLLTCRGAASIDPARTGDSTIELRSIRDNSTDL